MPAEGRRERIASGILDYRQYHFSRGIPFSPGSAVKAVLEISQAWYPLTMTSYIPIPSGTITTVSTVGLIVMAVVVLGAGVVVLVKRRQPSTA